MQEKIKALRRSLKTKEELNYLNYIEEHYNNVQKAWLLIQDKCKHFSFITDDWLFNQLDNDIKNHDLSKLSKNEFSQYRQFFYPANDKEEDKSLYDKAWEHHKKHNNHHWQTWTKYSNRTNQELALLHNICDWVAMGFMFEDTAKEYYENNKKGIKMPQWAIVYMYKIFDCIY